MKKLIVLGLLLIFLSISSSSAYTNEGGLQTNDKALMDYVLTVDGKEENSGEKIEFTISSSSLINGFYTRVLGMKINEERSFYVPVGEGYTNPNDPNTGHLANRELHFYVKLHEITYNVQGNDYIISTDAEITTTFSNEPIDLEPEGSLIGDFVSNPIFLMSSAVIIAGGVYFKTMGGSTAANVAEAAVKTKSKRKSVEELLNLED